MSASASTSASAIPSIFSKFSESELEVLRKNISFSEPISKDNSPKKSFINVGERAFRVRTPLLRAPFGSSSKTWGNNATPSYSLSLSLGSSTTEEKQFIKFLETIDERIVENAFEKQGEFITGKKRKSWSKDDIKDNYISLVTESFSENGEYPPNLRLKFSGMQPFRNVSFIDSKTKTAIELNGEENWESLVPKGSKVSCIFKVSYMGLAPGDKFYVKIFPESLLISRPVDEIAFEDAFDDLIISESRDSRDSRDDTENVEDPQDY